MVPERWIDEWRSKTFGSSIASDPCGETLVLLPILRYPIQFLSRQSLALWS